MKQKSTDQTADAPQAQNENFDIRNFHFEEEEMEACFNPDNTLLEFNLNNSRVISSQRDNSAKD